jgi:hypothetical protein
MTQPSEAPGAPTGEGEGGQAPTDTQQQGTTTGPAAPAAPTPTPAQKDSQAQSTEPQDVTSLPQWAQDVISKARASDAEYRTKYQAAQKDAQALTAQRDKMLAAIGLKPDGTAEPPTPEELTAQIEEHQLNAWEQTVENTVLRMAAAKPAEGQPAIDADLLLDSNAFFTSLSNLDDTSRDALQQHIAAFVAENPKFQKQATAPAPPARGSTDFNGGNGSGSPITEDQLSRMTPEQIAKAYADGRLSHLL